MPLKPMNEVSSPTSTTNSSSSSPSKKTVKSLRGWSFRKNKSNSSKSNNKKTTKRASKAASIIMDGVVKDSDSSTTEIFDNEDDAAPANSDTGLDLVVLLMHPLSHRFELLQLEFEEANKAKVSDLLGQIPLSVTEACLKDQLYDSILDQNSTDQGRPLVLKSSRLVDSFRCVSKQKKNNKSTGASRKMVVVARPQGLSNEDALKMAKPIFTNKDISTMLEFSGFDVKCWETKKFVSRSSSVSLTKDMVTSPKNNGSNSSIVENSSTSLTLLGVVVAMIIGMLLQSVMVRPTSPDFVLKPGSYNSKCGLFGFIPMKVSSCQDEFLRVNHDGTATLYDSDRQAIMIISGSLCSSSSKSSSSSDDCVNGLVMRGSDKSLEMGGTPIRQVVVRKSHKEQKLAPWPFEEEPAKLKYKIGASSAFSSLK